LYFVPWYGHRGREKGGHGKERAGFASMRRIERGPGEGTLRIIISIYRRVIWGVGGGDYYTCRSQSIKRLLLYEDGAPGQDGTAGTVL
jgi:hypothetical protein